MPPCPPIGSRYDEATPAMIETIQHGIPSSKCVIFKNSGHFPHIEETGRYLEVLSRFLGRVEAGG